MCECAREYPKWIGIIFCDFVRPTFRMDLPFAVQVVDQLGCQCMQLSHLITTYCHFYFVAVQVNKQSAIDASTVDTSASLKQVTTSIKKNSTCSFVNIGILSASSSSLRRTTSPFNLNRFVRATPPSEFIVTNEFENTNLFGNGKNFCCAHFYQSVLRRDADGNIQFRSFVDGAGCVCAVAAVTAKQIR